jgi:hypothetical protein
MIILEKTSQKFPEYIVTGTKTSKFKIGKWVACKTSLRVEDFGGGRKSPDLMPNNTMMTWILRKTEDQR